MKPCRLFISQQALDQWTSEGRAVLTNDVLLDQNSNLRYRLREGFRFVSEVSGADDVHKLVGKVKDLDQLAELKGEQMADSVVLGDNAYQVQAGLVGTPLTEPPAPPKPPQDETMEALQMLILGRIK